MTDVFTPAAHTPHASSLLTGDWPGCSETDKDESTRYICMNISSTVGHNTVGHNTVGHETVGHNTVGHDTVRHNTVGHNTVGHDTVGHNTVGHTVAAGHSPVGHAMMHTLGHCIH